MHLNLLILIFVTGLFAVCSGDSLQQQQKVGCSVEPSSEEASIACSKIADENRSHSSYTSGEQAFQKFLVDLGSKMLIHMELFCNGMKSNAVAEYIDYNTRKEVLNELRSVSGNKSKSAALHKRVPPVVDCQEYRINRPSGDRGPQIGGSFYHHNTHYLGQVLDLLFSNPSVAAAFKQFRIYLFSPGSSPRISIADRVVDAIIDVYRQTEHGFYASLHKVLVLLWTWKPESAPLDQRTGRFLSRPTILAFNNLLELFSASKCNAIKAIATEYQATIVDQYKDKQQNYHHLRVYPSASGKRLQKMIVGPCLPFTDDEHFAAGFTKPSFVNPPIHRSDMTGGLDSWIKLAVKDVLLTVPKNYVIFVDRAFELSKHAMEQLEADGLNSSNHDIVHISGTKTIFVKTSVKFPPVKETLNLNEILGLEIRNTTSAKYQLVGCIINVHSPNDIIKGPTSDVVKLKTLGNSMSITRRGKGNNWFLNTDDGFVEKFDYRSLDKLLKGSTSFPVPSRFTYTAYVEVLVYRLITEGVVSKQPGTGQEKLLKNRQDL